MKFGEKEITKEKFYAAKRPTKIWDVNVDNIAISKLVKIKTNSRYLIGYSDNTVRPVVLKMSKMSGYAITFKVKKGNNKLMSFHINDEKLLEKCKAI